MFRVVLEAMTPPPLPYQRRLVSEVPASPKYTTSFSLLAFRQCGIPAAQQFGAKEQLAHNLAERDFTGAGSGGLGGFGGN